MSREAWLLAEIRDWVRDGLLSEAQAQTLAQRYRQEPASADWVRLIFPALGAVVFGLGVILAFAYNWDSMHRFAKLGVIAAALFVTHVGGAKLFRAESGYQRLGESLHLLGTMLFGAGIWLVAQIYHVDEHYPNAFLIWSLAALSMAWVLPSVAHGLLAAVLLLAWSGFEAFEFGRVHHVSPWLVAGGLLPLAWQQRSQALLLLSLATFTLLYALGVGRLENELVLPVLWLLCGSYLAAGRMARHSSFGSASGAFTVLGSAGVLLFLFVASFRDVASSLMRNPPDSLPEWLYCGLGLTAILGLWAAHYLRGAAVAETADERLETVLLLITLLTLLFAGAGLYVGLLAWSVFNLVLLAHGAILIHRGARQQRRRQVALGCLVISALVFARFTDLFESLLWRALLFLLLGAMLFLVGMHYARQARPETADA